MDQKIAIIIGAGPAGLTAAFELLEHTDIKPIIFEMTQDIGGISKTVNYKGNRIDIGGHRFFSKSEKVMNWWKEILPLQGMPSSDDIILDRDIPLSSLSHAPDPEKTNVVMLIRNRISRIFFLRSFFDYPISIKFETFQNLGIYKIVRIGLSYVRVRLFKIRKETSLEDFLINRFGRELYKLFFRDYTEKVWGVPCNKIKPEWGAQRIKGLSITKTLIHAFKQIFKRTSSIEQKDTETSLIEQFMYPKLGPGQLWEEVSDRIIKRGGEIYLNMRVVGLNIKDGMINSVEVMNADTKIVEEFNCNFTFSTMPVKELVSTMHPAVPDNIKKTANGLQYRDFITVGLLLKKMKIKNKTKIPSINDIVPDNWIYIQERDVKLGRLQIFNNWSPYMVSSPDTVWIGLEYFCNEGDDLWSKNDEDFIKFAIKELISIQIIDEADVLDSTIIRMPKAYPAYFGTYDKFEIIRNYTDQIKNLFLIGRNGMHRYNNADHSMLTAMLSVENIIKDIETKENIWEVNAEEEYHEEKK